MCVCVCVYTPMLVSNINFHRKAALVSLPISNTMCKQCFSVLVLAFDVPRTTVINDAFCCVYNVVGMAYWLQYGSVSYPVQVSDLQP